MSSTEVSIQIDNSFTDNVCNYTVGFLKFENRDRVVTPAGSGIFARVGKRYGILSAGHAVKNLPDDKVALVRFPNITPALQNFKLDMNHTERIVSWSGKDGDAPDLGFLKIPELVARDLEAKGSVFYDLQKTRTFAVSQPNHQMAKAYAVAGVVAEWVESGPGDQPNTKKTTVGGVFGPAKITDGFSEGNADLVVVEISYADKLKTPKSHEGISGSGLWEVHVELDGKEIVSVNKKLYGIAFWQSGDHRRVTSNSMSAIQRFVDDIAKKWPDER